MSLDLLQERLDRYQPTSHQEEQQAILEITQEIALAGLSRAGFFKKAIFQGGTALRILYSLQRFSEDLDFMLVHPDRSFEWNRYFQGLSLEFAAFNYSVKLEDRSEADETVKKAFLKDNSVGKVLKLRHPLVTGRPKQIQIKFEIDINPPQGSRSEVKYLDFPYDFPVVAQDLPSLFAGKCHALLCRGYVKGRDWYDLLWYCARKTSINYAFLSHALEQQGPWQGKKIVADPEWFLREMEKKIRSIDWETARGDVRRFLKPRDINSLALWTADFFLEKISTVV